MSRCDTEDCHRQAEWKFTGADCDGLVERKVCGPCQNTMDLMRGVQGNTVEFRKILEKSEDGS